MTNGNPSSTIADELLELILTSTGELLHNYQISDRVYAIHGYGQIVEDIFTVYTVSEDRDEVYQELQGGVFDHFPSRAEVAALIEQ